MKRENLTPKISERIWDKSELFTEQQEDSLFDLIRDLDVKLGPEIGIITIDSLNGEEINEFSLRMTDEMILGRRNFKDGILLTHSRKDKIVRIEIGLGLEKMIPDDLAKQIIQQDMIPKFREGNFFDGFYSGVSHLKKIIEENKQLIGVF